MQASRRLLSLVLLGIAINHANSAAITISVTPETAAVRVGATKKFYASVSGTTDKTVVWYVNNVAGGAAATGTIDADGTYTAPAPPPITPEAAITSWLALR